MKNNATIATIALLTLVNLPVTANAQNDAPGDDRAKTTAQETIKQPAVTLDVRGAHLRDVLEMLFKQAKLDFMIEPGVGGFVTMKVTDLPFEATLKLVLRSGSTPLAYTLENGVYIIRSRTMDAPATVAAPPPPVYPETAAANSGRRFEVIQLVHADPADLAQLLNITLLPLGTRFGNTGAGGFGGLGIGGGFPGAGMGGARTGNGAQNTPGNNNTGRGANGIGTPGGAILIAP